jgi:hypothetical protein
MGRSIKIGVGWRGYCWITCFICLT